MPGIFISSLLFASLFLFGQSIDTRAKQKCHRILYPPSEIPHTNRRFEIPQKVLKTEDGRINPILPAPPLFGKPISQEGRAKWIVKCNSEQAGYECSKAVDGSDRTFWHAEVDTTGQQLNPWPLTIDIDLRAVKNVNAISMKPRLNVANQGIVAGHMVYLSLDGKRWGDPVAYGTWSGDETDKYAIFEPQPAQYVRFQATSAANGKPFISIEDFSVWANDQFTPSPLGLGKWGPSVNFPLVPAAVFVNPTSGEVIAFSSFQRYGFHQANTNHSTLTSTCNLTARTVNERRVFNTNHDMFCPGTAYDADGRMVITGGVSDNQTTIYNPNTDEWKIGGVMNIRRGYQGSTTFSDGRIFVIGGSWAPEPPKPYGNRNGEMYDHKAKKWTEIDGCLARTLQTTEDWEGEYRSDNHMWLFGWKNNSIFHAGPAKTMNWITVTGTKGAVVGAGTRGEPGKPVDSDAMCGVAAMYDAVKGKILTAGGAPQYKYCDDEKTGDTHKPATNHAFIITLNNTNGTVNVKEAGGRMKFQRIFHHAVILPNGDTLVVGGQKLGQGFTDQTPVLTPEIYSPARGTNKDSWTPVATHSIARTYHSFGLLLQNATVLVGGGGLCGDGCEENHFDAQIYTPQYLLTQNGDPAPRPSITKLSPTAAPPGAILTITTKSAVAAASLLRYGSSTHSLNNDQRRIELDLNAAGTGTNFQYKVSIPSEKGIAIPGYWMLFVIDALGVPSEAKNVQIQIAT
ncbi:hypothetical protein GP486_005227 [Trichoglossum hirsutum]|uniref:F5/8 type C domain-containing protein n=1 Tax=Trichoglossum hirsutum TaxID=265104 RepID=A0A9P8L9T4_9PEZI|nr:hypothetical protein GP486_005227 [Trichoglossum hirsutum]